MDTTEDNTAVIRMKKDFEDFLSQNKSQSRHGLSFGGSFLDSSRGGVQESEFKGVSMQQVLSKEKEDRQRQVAYVTAKTEISRLQTEINHLQSAKKRSRVEYEKDVESLKYNYERELDKYSELKHQLHVMNVKEFETKEELVQTRKTLDLTKATFEQKVLALQKEKHKLESELQEVEQTLRQKVTDLKSENLRQQTEYQICLDQLQEEQQQHALTRRRCSEMSQRLEELEEVSVKAVTSDHRIMELEQKLSKLEEDSTIATAMKSQITQSLELEKENRKLKDENAYYKDSKENVLLLREETQSLKQKLERMQKNCLELQQSQLDYDEMKKKLEKWDVIDSHGNKCPQSPTQMSRTIADLQNSNAILLEKQGHLTASLHTNKDQVTQKEKQISMMQQHINREQYKVVQLADQVKRLQKKLLLVSKEREGYKRIIDSYENEVTINIAATTAQRLAEQEQVNTGYHKHISELEKELVVKTESLDHLNGKCFKLQQEIISGEKHQNIQQVPSEADHKLVSNLREKIADLEKSLEKITEDKELLEARIERCNSQGDYDPTKTKVVHFSMNPLAIAKKQRAQEIARLKEENEKLKKRLQVLEESGGKVEDITMLVDQKLQEPSSNKELDNVKQQLTSAELKNKRLMEAFGKTSKEFREVCYQLLGYKLDIPVSNQYRLLSMYSERQEDYLLFQLSQNGEMQMLGTDFSSSLDDKIKTYLHGANSIPAFLSSVTLDLFNSQTIMQ